MFATEFDKGKGNINETLKLFKKQHNESANIAKIYATVSAYAKFNAFIREFEVSNKKEHLAIGN